MAWTGIARQEHSRQGLRYSSDMTDREWALAAPFIPGAKRGGRRRTTDMREVLNALLYIAASGFCPNASRRSRRSSAISTPGATLVCSRR